MVDQPQDNPENGVILTPEQEKRRRTRNIAIALVLVGLAVLFYVLTVVRLGGDVLNRAF